MLSLAGIKIEIENGNVEEAIQTLNEMLADATFPSKDEAYYLRGNAYRKQGNWQEAMNSYQKAIDLNPHSPAMEARRAIIDILNFFNKDMYNQ